MMKDNLKGGTIMHGWFRVFFSIWLIFYSLSILNPAIQPVFLVVLAAIVFIVAIMEVIKKK
ncbi:MAG: hypothetical protein C0412_21255 [Flavobacterium sp.]|nr:hypothetical protein [Flavobacterium sp.]